MARTERYPWRQGTFRLAPAGLREAVLRVQLMDLTELERFATAPAATAYCTPMLATVAGWRLGQGCTAREWDQLVALVGRVKYTKRVARGVPPADD